MKTLAATAAALALLGLPFAAAAQTIPPANTAKVFVAVDAVRVEDGKIVVTGVVQGDAAPSTWSAGFYYSQDAAAKAVFVNTCQTQALLAMTRPGQYLLELQNGSGSSGSGYSYTPICKLSRPNP